MICILKRVTFNKMLEVALLVISVELAKGNRFDGAGEGELCSVKGNMFGGAGEGEYVHWAGDRAPVNSTTLNYLGLGPLPLTSKLGMECAAPYPVTQCLACKMSWM